MPIFLLASLSSPSCCLDVESLSWQSLALAGLQVSISLWPRYKSKALVCGGEWRVRTQQEGPGLDLNLGGDWVSKPKQNVLL
jgi:hypothetical protein